MSSTLGNVAASVGKACSPAPIHYRVSSFHQYSHLYREVLIISALALQGALDPNSHRDERALLALGLDHHVGLPTAQGFE